MLPNNTDKHEVDFLIDVYKIRVQFHSEHTNRMWTRFNFLLTAEIALLGSFFAIWGNKSFSLESLFTLRILGVFVSVLWYILGAQDHYYFEGFRKQAQFLEKVIAEKIGTSTLNELSFGQVTGIKRNLVTWQWRMISLSKLIAIFPMLFLALWITMLFIKFV